MHHQRKLEQELKAGTEAETVEDAAYWLAVHGFISLLSHAMQDHFPRDVTAHSELGLPIPIINQGSPPPRLVYNQCFGGIFSKAPLFRYVLACAKLTKINQLRGMLDGGFHHLTQCKKLQISGWQSSTLAVRR